MMHVVLGLAFVFIPTAMFAVLNAEKYLPAHLKQGYQPEPAPAESAPVTTVQLASEPGQAIGPQVYDPKPEPTLEELFEETHENFRKLIFTADADSYKKAA